MDSCVTRYLTDNETVHCYVKQRQIFGFWPLRPNYVVLTDKRFMVISPTLLSCSFQDISWQDIKDIQLSEQILSSTLACRSTDGRMLVMNKLIKAKALEMYKAGQQLEEQMREYRRQLDIQHAQAGATNISMGN
ncbi:MAG: PH domain-containing protein [Akkermansia sp.]